MPTIDEYQGVGGAYILDKTGKRKPQKPEPEQPPTTTEVTTNGTDKEAADPVQD